MENQDNGHHEEKIMDRESFFENDFEFPHSTDNTKFLVQTGTKSPKDLYTIADIQDARLAFYFSEVIRRDNAHDYAEGIEQCHDIMALLTSIGAKRAELYSDTIIGERQHDQRRGGVGDWLRDKARIGVSGDQAG